MKKTLAILLAMTMAFSAVALAVAADFDVTLDGTKYTVIQPESIEFVPMVKDEANGVSNVPQGGCTLDALIDGDVVRGATAFGTKGIVLIKNEYIGANAVTGSVAAEQDPELVPDFAFSLDLGSVKEFDTAYFMVYHQIQACIAIPADKKVIVEVSEDSNVWVPVGIDGEFYMNVDVDDYDQDAPEDAETVECAVYLGEEVSARYVRYTFTFMPVPEAGYWEYYTNIHEWIGFTEVGVALWTDGEEPEVLDPNLANTEPTKVEGSWIGDDGVEVKIMNFVNNAGVKTVDVTIYESEAYLENGIEAPVTEAYTATYSVVGNRVTITYEDGSIDKMSATIDEDGDLTLGTGINAVVYSPYEAPAPVEMSGVWFAEVDGAVMVVDFSTANVMKMITYEAGDFEANGTEGTALLTMEYAYTAGPSYIDVDMDGTISRLTVSYEGETLILDDGEVPMNLAPYVPKEPEVSQPEDESSEPEDETSEEGDTSAEASAPATSTPATSTDAPVEDDGDSTLVIVIVAVAAVVVIAVVVVFIVKKKK